MKRLIWMLLPDSIRWWWAARQVRLDLDKDPAVKQAQLIRGKS